MLVSLQTQQPYGTDSNLPVTVAQLKARLRISNNSEDDFIKECIQTAVRMLENYTRRSFVEQTHTLTIDELGDDFNTVEIFLGSKSVIYLGMPPVLSVTSLKFFDDEGNDTLIDSSNYYLDKRGGRIVPAQGYTWQADQRRVNAVEVVYKAGYIDVTGGQSPSDLDPMLKSAIGQLAAYFYENRIGECSIPDTIKKTAKAFRLARLGVPYMGIDFNQITVRSGSLRGGY